MARTGSNGPRDGRKVTAMACAVGFGGQTGANQLSAEPAPGTAHTWKRNMDMLG